MYPTDLDDVRRRFANLTTSEQRVLQLVLEKMSNALISKTLAIAIRTVELRRHNILQKLGARHLPELVRLCLMLGFPTAPTDDIDQLRKKFGTLTDKEKAVLALMVENVPSRVIAQRLGLGLRTIELRRSQIGTKLGRRHVIDLVRFAVQVDFCHEPVVGPHP
jgi:FixJ family two-component response regulator